MSYKNVFIVERDHVTARTANNLRRTKKNDEVDKREIYYILG
jgi:hypothetical protein